MNRRTVVVSGGMLDEEFTLQILKSEETEYIVAADHGLEFLYKHIRRNCKLLQDRNKSANSAV